MSSWIGTPGQAPERKSRHRLSISTNCTVSTPHHEQAKAKPPIPEKRSTWTRRTPLTYPPRTVLGADASTRGES
jgi:hypothetical protein